MRQVWCGAVAAMLLAGCAGGTAVSEPQEQSLVILIDGEPWTGQAPLPVEVVEVPPELLTEPPMPIDRGEPAPVSEEMSVAELVAEGEGLPAIRTTWSDATGWTRCRTDLDNASDEFGNAATLTWHPGSQFDGWTVEDILAATPAAEYTAALLVFDAASASVGECTLLAVETGGPERGRTFRIQAGEIVSFEINLSLSNMNFFDFADSAGPDGVFRGFGD